MSNNDMKLDHLSFWNNSAYEGVINPFGAETRIFSGSYVSTMATDALAPCITRTPVAVLLTMWGRWINVFVF